MYKETETIKFYISIVVYWDAIHILKDNTNGISRFFLNKWPHHVSSNHCIFACSSEHWGGLEMGVHNLSLHAARLEGTFHVANCTASSCQLAGLPWRPPADLHFDDEGVLLLVLWAMMNLVSLSSFKLILLWASCKIETCSVIWVMVNIWEFTVWFSEVNVMCNCWAVTGWKHALVWDFWVLIELIVVLTVDSESIIDSSSTLIFLHFGATSSTVSTSQYSASKSEMAKSRISSLLLQMHFSRTPISISCPASGLPV